MNIDNIKVGKKLGQGKFGICYLMENGYILKKFNVPLPVVDLDKFKYFLKYKNDSIMFPINFIYDDVYLYGHISKRAFGKRLVDTFSSSNLLNMSTRSIKLENNIKYISKGKIQMFDIHDENVIYDGNKFSVIDTDQYFKMNNLYTIKEVENINIGYYKNMIKELTISNLSKFKYNRFIIDKLYKYEKLDISGSEMIYKIKCDLDKYYKEDIKSIEDIGKVIR